MNLSFIKVMLDNNRTAKLYGCSSFKEVYRNIGELKKLYPGLEILKIDEDVVFVVPKCNIEIILKELEEIELKLVNKFVLAERAKKKLLK